jgi:hypothetical protein
MRFGPALVLAAALPLSAALAQTATVRPFHAVEVHGGGEVILRHGTSQRVTLLKGDPKTAEIEVDSQGTLHLSPCARPLRCVWHTGPFEVEVVTPTITSVEAYGGGEARAEGAFPTQPNLKVRVYGGGEADVKAIPAQKVEADIRGGGAARVHALETLVADVRGGGDLHYWGHPHITSDVRGGGSIAPGD